MLIWSHYTIDVRPHNWSKMKEKAMSIGDDCRQRHRCFCFWPHVKNSFMRFADQCVIGCVCMYIGILRFVSFHRCEYDRLFRSDTGCFALLANRFELALSHSNYFLFVSPILCRLRWRWWRRMKHDAIHIKARQSNVHISFASVSSDSSDRE